MQKTDIPKFQNALLAHYTIHRRALPWREDGITPYEIWLSEIMLQQTTVAAVIPYFHRFLEAFPTLHSLANASEQQVFALWEGLGYYSRARNLLKCAQTLVSDYNATFPTTPEDLIKLPGIGPYTAAAVSAIGFNHPATVVDGNVERVMSRLHRVQEELPKAKSILREKAEALTPHHAAKDYAGAIMDLGATICTPRSPKCGACPVYDFCDAAAHGDQASYPRKAPKKAKPTKQGIAYIITNTQGDIFLRQRTEKSLLKNLWETPHSNWEDTFTPPQAGENKGTIKHVFTHFTLKLDVHYLQTTKTPKGGKFFPKENLPPLPTLFKKVLERGEYLHQ